MSVMSSETVIWLIICIAGNMFQIYQISDIFFSYKVTTSTSVLFPTKLEPPNMVHSYYLLDLVKWEELFKLKPRLREELKYDNLSFEQIIELPKNMTSEVKQKMTAKVFEGMTIEEIMKLTYGPEEILANCMSINKDTIQLNTAPKCTDHFKIDTYFHDFMYRDIVFEPKNAEIDYMSVKMATGVPGFLYSISLKKEFLKRIIRMPITYNVRGDKFSVGFSEFVMLQDTSQWVLMSFILSISRLLPKPFPTKCVDYQAQGFKGRGSCYDACATKLSLERLGGKLYPGPDVDPDFPHVPISIPELASNASMVRTVLQITNECNAKCSGYECLSQILVPSIDSTFPTDDAALLMTLILREPCVDTTYSQSLGMIEFITAAGSTLGFWIGLSLFHFAEVFKSISRMVRKLFGVNGSGSGREGRESDFNGKFSLRSFKQQLKLDTRSQVMALLYKWQQRADFIYQMKTERQRHSYINSNSMHTLTDANTRRSVADDSRIGYHLPERQYYSYTDPNATSIRHRVALTDANTRRSVVDDSCIGYHPPERQYYSYSERIAE